MSTAIRAALKAISVGALGATAFAFAVSPGPSAAQPAPPSSVVCPGIEEDGLLCSNDPISGNCEDFVTEAAQLGALYRTELAERPGSQASLMTTNWWGCGPSRLEDVKALLERIGTPRAMQVLRDEPYASLAGPPPPPPPPPGLADPQLNCVELANPSERSACIGVRLQSARAEHQRVFERCRDVVAPGLRDDLVQDEASFTALLPTRCAEPAAGQGDEDEGVQTFERSRCLVEALTDNTRGMLAAHPECAAPN